MTTERARLHDAADGNIGERFTGLCGRAMVVDGNTAAVEDKARLVSAVLGLPCHRSARRERSRRGTWMDGRGHGLDDLGCPVDGLGAGRARGHAGGDGQTLPRDAVGGTRSRPVEGDGGR